MPLAPQDATVKEPLPKDDSNKPPFDIDPEALEKRLKEAADTDALYEAANLIDAKCPPTGWSTHRGRSAGRAEGMTDAYRKPAGSPEWHAHRAQHLSPDAPAMMSCSPYKTRAELVRELATGIRQEFGPEQQAILDSGHVFERSGQGRWPRRSWAKILPGGRRRRPLQRQGPGCLRCLRKRP